MSHNPPFVHHVKMMVICLGTAVSLAVGIMLSAYGAYQAVIWIGSH
jgi:hypothetical protein